MTLLAESLVADWAPVWQRLQVHTVDMLHQVPLDIECLGAVLALESVRVLLLVHQLNVLVHVVLQMESFSTVLAEQAEFTVDVHVAPQASPGQEGFLADLTAKHLCGLVRTVDMLSQASTLGEHAPAIFAGKLLATWCMLGLHVMLQ